MATAFAVNAPDKLYEELARIAPVEERAAPARADDDERTVEQPKRKGPAVVPTDQEVGELVPASAWMPRRGE